ncbi:MAG: hypothetical protein ABIQ59_03765 [Nocardioidaceae bacterium]
MRAARRGARLAEDGAGPTLCGGAVVGALIRVALAVWTGASLWAPAATVLASQPAAALLIATLGLDVSGPSVVTRRAEPTVQLLLAFLVLLLVFGPDQDPPVDFHAGGLD